MNTAPARPLLPIALLLLATVVPAMRAGASPADSPRLAAAVQQSTASLATATPAAAAQRRALLGQLAALDPVAALAAALTPEAYAALPAAVRAECEVPVSCVGDFLVRCALAPAGTAGGAQLRYTAVINGIEYPARAYGWRLTQMSARGVPLTGILLDGVFVASADAIAPVEGAALPAAGAVTDVGPIKGVGVIGRVAGRLYRFAGAGRLAAAEQAIRAAQQTPGARLGPLTDMLAGHPLAAAAAADWTTGNKKVLLVRCDFSDLPGTPVSLGTTTVTADYAQNVMDAQVSPFYLASSYGRTSFTTTVSATTYRLPQTASYYATHNATDQLAHDALALARADYPGSYDRYVFVFSDLGNISGSQFSAWAGLADVGGTYVWANGECTLRVLAHEEGHNLGVHHANLWQVHDGDPISASGSNTEYGDAYDIMGDNGGTTSDFNPQFKRIFGWLSPAQVQPVSQPGHYRLYMFDSPTRVAGDLVALTYQRDATHTYVVSYRGAWTGATAADPQTSITRGACIQWTSNSTHTETQLLDMMTPGANYEDAALPVGATFADPTIGFAVTVDGLGGAGADKYVDVSVTFFDPGRLPIITVGTAQIGQAAVITAHTATAPARMQLFVDGALWGESTAAPAKFTWEPQDLATHVIAVKAWYDDGTVVTNSTLAQAAPATAAWVFPQPHGLWLTGVAHAFGKWWTISYEHCLVTSSFDARTWTMESSPADQTCLGFASDDTQLIASTTGGSYTAGNGTGTGSRGLWRFTEGHGWQPLTGPVGGGALIYANGTWVSVTSQRQVETSTDGINWTSPVALPALPNGVSYGALAYGGGHWVVAASNSQVAVSSDLVTWTLSPVIDSTTLRVTGIAYSNGTWLLGIMPHRGISEFVYLSKDLQTWSRGNSPDGTWWQSVTAIGGQFVAFTSNNACLSTDGLSWTKVFLPNSEIEAVAANGGTCVAVGVEGRVYTGSSIPTLTLCDATPRPDITGAVVMPDGATLVSTNSVTGTGQPYSAVALFRDGVFTPTDAPSGNSYYAIAAKGGTYVAASNTMLYSTDAQHWNAAPAFFNQTPVALATSSDVFVAAGYNGIIVSTDGRSWTPRATGTGNPLVAIASDGHRFVAVGKSGTVVTSPDGQQWSTVSVAGVTDDFTAVVWQPGLGFCALNNFNLYLSPDGVTWRACTIPLTAPQYTGTEINLGGGAPASINVTAVAPTPAGLAIGTTSSLYFTPDGINFASTPLMISPSCMFYADQRLFVTGARVMMAVSLQPVALVPLRIARQPAGASVTEGTAVALSVAVTGSGPLGFQWSRGGVPIAGATDSVLAFSAAQPADTGDYTVTVRNSLGSVVSAPATLAVGPNPVHLLAGPLAQSVAPGGNATFSVSATADAALSYQWYRNGTALPGATTSTLTVANVGAGAYGHYSVTLSTATGSMSAGAVLAPPMQLQGPADALTVAPGATVALTLATVTPGATYQWSRNGAPIPGATGATLVTPATEAGAHDTFSVAAAIDAVTARSDPVTVNSTDTAEVGHLVNVSVLTQTGAGAAALSVGFVSNGTKQVVIRGIGPSLARFGVAGLLPDPQLALIASPGQVGGNDDWGGGSALSDAFAATGAFPLDPASKDAAILATVNGLYSARVTGAADAPTGAALLEVYDTTSGPFTPDTPRLVNVSCRAEVGPGGKAVTVGFVIGGSTARTVLVRAIGPALARFGLGGVLADPKLTLYAQDGPVGGNDNWGPATPSSVFSTVGAFPLDDVVSKDGALVMTLPPGVYSVKVEPADGASSGLALAEVYEVP